MNAKQVRKIIDREFPKALKKILAERQAKADAAKRNLDEHRKDIHYVLDQASKGKPTSEEV